MNPPPVLFDLCTEAMQFGIGLSWLPGDRDRCRIYGDALSEKLVEVGLAFPLQPEALLCATDFL